MSGLYTGYDSKNNHWEIYKDDSGWHWRKFDTGGKILEIVNGTGTYESCEICEETIRSLYGMDGKFSSAFKAEILPDMTSTNQEFPVSAETLKKEWKNLYDGFSDDPTIKGFKEKHEFPLRLRRAISWLGRAQQMERDVKGTDKELHTRFIFLWIGFNALYARDPHESPFKEDYIKIYFLNLSNCGKQQVTDRIYKIIDSNISKEKIRSLSNNKFISTDFWDKKIGIFKKGKEKDQPLPEPLSKEKTLNILLCVFQRLSVLRNQLVHGSTTWDSHLGIEQLRDGTEIMRWLLPVFIQIMLETPEDKRSQWGRVYYPRVENKPILKNESEPPKNET